MKGFKQEHRCSEWELGCASRQGNLVMSAYADKAQAAFEFIA
jgi:hypothetical protein